jgi:drug/metabolite transporter (DMT)-like permease
MRRTRSYTDLSVVERHTRHDIRDSESSVNAFVGELAALAAALGFSVTSVFYTFAGRKINPVVSIAMSLPISWLMMIAIHRLTLGVFFPTDATLERWFHLGASGLLAFVVSSYFMLNAFQDIGPRLAMLIASFAPVLGALLAWLFLGQTLPPNATIGIAVVIFGIGWVVVQRGRTSAVNLELDVRRGVLFACLGTLTQAAAFVFSKLGVAGAYPPFSATLIRITVGMIALWIFIALQRNIKSTVTIFNHDRKLLLQLTMAALSGSVIATSLLLLSFQHIPLGVATTLSHTTSIMLIPIGYFVFKERITLSAIIGTLVTIIGIGILFMS